MHITLNDHTICIDPEDAYLLDAEDWRVMHVDGRQYVARYQHRRRFVLAREIAGAQPGQAVTYRNGNTLDLRRANLIVGAAPKIATITNQRRTLGGASPYRGVTWDAREEKWRADIYPNGQNVYLGHYDDEQEAAAAYDEAARGHYGAQAALNLPK